MGKQHKKVSVKYLCPNCGNDAPPYMKKDTPWRCKWCKQTYYRQDRITEKA